MEQFWIFFLVVAGGVFTQAQPFSSIRTHPNFPGNVLATGYEGLRLTIQIESGLYEVCTWKFGLISQDIFTVGIPCINRNDSDYTSTCNIANNSIASSLIILFPVNGNVSVLIECQIIIGDGQILKIASLLLNVKDCATSAPLVVDSSSATYNSTGTFRCAKNENLYYANGTQTTDAQTTCLATAEWSGEESLACFRGCDVSYPLVVESDSTFYNSLGTFSCANNGTLFYSNGTQLISTQTTCLTTTKWSGQDGLECWKAPDVAINGELSVIEDNDITLTCDYVDVLPFGNLSVLYFGDVSVVQDKTAGFTLQNVKRSDNHKLVSCQALTPFTEIYPDTGRSNTRTVKVLHAPYQDNPSICTWVADTSQTCEILFHANTNVTVVQITKDGTLVEGLLSPVSPDGDDVASFYFGLLKDVTFADAGSYQVQLTSVVPPNDHIIYFEIDVVQNPAEGYLIGLICSVVYAVIVSVIAVVIYMKLSKVLKQKDQKVLYQPKNSKAASVPEGTYITIDDVKRSSAELNKPTEYLAPNQIMNEETNKLPAADGFENIVVSANEDFDDKATSSAKSNYENMSKSTMRTSSKKKAMSSSMTNNEYEIMNPQSSQE